MACVVALLVAAVLKARWMLCRDLVIGGAVAAVVMIILHHLFVTPADALVQSVLPHGAKPLPVVRLAIITTAFTIASPFIVRPLRYFSHALACVCRRSDHLAGRHQPQRRAGRSLCRLDRGDLRPLDLRLARRTAERRSSDDLAAVRRSRPHRRRRRDTAVRWSGPTRRPQRQRRCGRQVLRSRRVERPAVRRGVAIHHASRSGSDAVGHALAASRTRGARRIDRQPSWSSRAGTCVNRKGAEQRRAPRERGRDDRTTDHRDTTDRSTTCGICWPRSTAQVWCIGRSLLSNSDPMRAAPSPSST